MKLPRRDKFSARNSIRFWHKSVDGILHSHEYRLEQLACSSVAGGSDTLIGGSADDLLKGGGGNDVINGRGGNDDVAGNDGADFLDGGIGGDILRTDAFDVVLSDRGDLVV